MNRDTFFSWSEAQDGRYEFDGVQPVAMGNVPVNHGLITNAIHRALFDRLKGTPCRALGPEVGLSTVGDTIRNLDASVLTGGDMLRLPDIGAENPAAAYYEDVDFGEPAGD